MPQKATLFQSPGEISRLICFDLLDTGTEFRQSPSLFPHKTACCRACGDVGEKPESVGNLWAALARCARIAPAVHGLSTRPPWARAGPQGSGLVHRPLSANMTETPAHLRITVGRCKVRTHEGRERLDDIRTEFRPRLGGLGA